MRCEDAVRDLPRYAEGTMSGWSRLMLSLHVARCSPCRQRLAALGECGRSLAEALQTPVDAPDMSDSVMAAIGQSLPASRARLDRKWVAVPVAVAGALAAILVAVQRQPVAIEPHRQSRAIVAEAPSPPQDAQAPGLPSHGFKNNVGGVHVPERPRPHERIATAPKWRTTPKRSSQDQQPAVACEKPPEPVSVASSKIVVVVRHPEIVSNVEVEATNPATGAVVRYTACYDSAGNRQSTYTAFTKDDSDKEGT